MRIDYKKYKFISKKVDIKIVHISDIHFSKNYKVKRLDIVKNKIETLKPNYICITGDLIDAYDATVNDNFKYFLDWIDDLSNICKLIIITGNHEFIKRKNGRLVRNDNFNWLKKIENDQIKVLNNEIYTEGNITFIGYDPGYDCYYKYKEKNFIESNIKLSKLLSNLSDNYNILLTHAPSTILYDKNYQKIKNIDKVNLVLCGHTHGGLMPSLIPGHFGLVSPAKTLFPSQVRGKIKVNDTFLIINSGIMKLSERSKLSKYNDIYGANITEINIFTKK